MKKAIHKPRILVYNREAMLCEQGSEIFQSKVEDFLYLAKSLGVEHKVYS